MNEEQGNKERARRPIPFHPVLFAVAPILFVYAHNGARVPIDPHELLLPTGLSLGMTAILWVILWVLLRSLTRAAIVVSLFLVLFFSYGHIAEAYLPEARASVVLLLCWAVLLGTGTWLATRRPRGRVRGSLHGFTVLLDSIAVGIVTVNLVAGARAFANRPSRVERASRQSPPEASAGYPDIYYIIADSYGRSDVLRSRYHTEQQRISQRAVASGVLHRQPAAFKLRLDLPVACLFAQLHLPGQPGRGGWAGIGEQRSICPLDTEKPACRLSAAPRLQHRVVRHGC